MQKVKVTKRQRKALGRNAMVKSILANKQAREYELSGAKYVGLRKGAFGGDGIPFVRTR